MKQIIKTEKAPAAIGPYSQAVKVGDMLYLSGQIPINPSTGEIVQGDISSQTNQVMQNIKSVLAEAGLTMNNIVKCTIFLTDLGDFQKVNEIYGSYFPETHPARSCIEVSKLPKDAKVEIECITYEG